jgi:HK97 family phage major capsid protein
MRFTTLPFLLAMVMAIATMPTDIYQINAWNHGTEQTEPWRSKLSTLPIVSRVVAMANRVSEWLAELTDVPLLTSEVGAVGNIKQLLQDEADKKKAVAKAKKEGRDLFAIDEKSRTPEQAERFKAVFSELTALETELETIEANLEIARRLQDKERDNVPASHIAAGADRSAERPWGPTLHSDATPQMQVEARRAALGEFAIAVKQAASGEGMDPRLFAAGTGMNTMNQGDGGFAVPPEVAPGLEAGMFAAGEILSRVDARTITGDSIAYNVIDETSRATGSRAGAVQGYWVDQGTAPSASQIKLARIELKLRKVAALGYMTDELVSDASALGGELDAAFVDELIFQTEDTIVEGTGAGQPLGYQNAPCLVTVAKETGQAARPSLVANLSKMWARLPARSKKTAVWLINVDVEPSSTCSRFPPAPAPWSPGSSPTRPTAR